MQVTREQISPCEVELSVEVEAAEVDSALEETYREFADATNVPGFRKGKAPRAVLERHVGEDRLKDRAADKLVTPAYKAALEETQIEPFAPADVEVVKFEQGEPMVFKARVPLAPKIELGDYVGLAVERRVDTVTDEQVEERIQDILMRHARYDAITDRPVQMGDTVLVDLADEGAGEEPRRSVVQVGENIEAFDAGLVGMNLEEEKSIEITYGDDADEELRGTTVVYRVKVIEINERKLPELTDEWVKEMSGAAVAEGEEPPANAIDTVDKLRQAIRESLEKAARDVADMIVQDDIVRKVVEGSKVDFPEVMVSERVENRFEELAEDLKKRKVTVEHYLEHVGQTLEQLRDSFEQEARRTLANGLVIREIIAREKIEVTDEEIDAEIRSMADARRVPEESMRAYLEATDEQGRIRGRVLHRKAIDFLVHASNITTVSTQEEKS